MLGARECLSLALGLMFPLLLLHHNLCAVTLCSKPGKSDAPKDKGKKAPRVWALGGSANKEVLDYSTPTTNGAPEVAPPEDISLVRGNRV